ncbi:MAG TPA: PHP domain-containing protein [Solirubrobacteraceae bacterium]|nr:PHP domain-containing protein [Solirubrobacteraceae bacterium]
MTEPRFSIAHVTPYPWEAEDNEVNAHVERLATELSRRGHRVLVLAPSRSQERVRASRRALRAARTGAHGGAALLDGTDGGAPRVIAVGEVLDLRAGGRPGERRRRPAALPIDVARTVEEVLACVPLDLVHVHEPFAPSTSAAALRHSHALNVGSFHSSSERLLSTLVARRFVETFFGRLDARTASLRETAQLMSHHFPGDYELVRDDEHAADELERIYRRVAARRHTRAVDGELARRLARRAVIDVDLHMHTDHSYDCATPVEVLLASAREQGLGAIAVTDHNEISGALEAREQARSLAGAGAAPVKVIVGEEVKTADGGEVIGLFIEEKIPRGLTLAETVAEIRRQGGVVYVPHPFDRLHSVPDYEHLLEILDEVDAIEVFNPRVAISAFNDEAARFAAKYRLPAGAGSDSHVPQGLGSVRVRMRDFDGPAEFMQSLLDAEIVTRPSSLLYVQALKFLQTRATPRSARRFSRARRLKRLRRTHGGGRAPLRGAGR